MLNNGFTFRDTHWHQVLFTAIGTPLVLLYATTLFAIHEDNIQYYFTTHLTLYRRFIGNVVGICTPFPGVDYDATRSAFQVAMNNFHVLTY